MVTSDLDGSDIDQQVERVVEALMRLTEIAAWRRDRLDDADRMVATAVATLERDRKQAKQVRRYASRTLIKAVDEARLSGISKHQIDAAVGMAGNSLNDIKRNVMRWNKEDRR